MRNFLIIFGFVIVLAASHVNAQVVTSIRQNNVAVKASPNFSSETLVVLNAGTKLTVKGRNGDWFKVSLNRSGFEFVGWVEKSAFTGQAAAPAPTPPPPMNDSMDQFFDIPSSAPPPPRAPAKAASKSTRSSFKPRTASEGSLAQKLKLNAGLDFSFFQHSVSTTGTGKLFSYNLSGVGINLGTQYDYWASASQTMVASAELEYTHTFLLSKTNLKDTTGATFDTRDSKNSIRDFFLKTSLAYKTSPNLRFGGSLGLRYFSFKGDDIQDNSGNPLNLYVSSSLLSFPIGLYGAYTYNDAYDITIGANFLTFGSYSESPSGATGGNPTPKVGLNPYLSVLYNFRPSHRLGMSYDLLVQSVSYTGAATRATIAIADGATSTKVHQLGFKYQYAF